MESHVKLLGILHIVLSSLGALAAVTVLFVFGGLASIAGLSDRASDTGVGAAAVPVIGLIGGVIGIALLLISLPGLIGGIGLLRLAPWSRVLMIVISAIDLLNIPFGLALGIYGLWVLTKPETQALMDQRRYQTPAY